MALSIIEVVATAVAAVAAIIAVFVTVKIAKNQNALIVKQNEISTAQADIARQQNRIALFEAKYEVYQLCALFLSRWEYSCNQILDGKTDEEKFIGCIVAISLKMGKGDQIDKSIEQICRGNSSSIDLNAVIFGFYDKEVFLFRKASCLFVCLKKADMVSITDAYNDFIPKLRETITTKKIDEPFTTATAQFLQEINNFRGNDYLSEMEKEISALKE